MVVWPGSKKHLDGKVQTVSLKEEVKAWRLELTMPPNDWWTGPQAGRDNNLLIWWSLSLFWSAEKQMRTESPLHI